MAQLQSTSVSGSIIISGSTSSTGLAQVVGSGSTVFYISGSTGGLMSVSDSTTGSLLSIYTGSSLIFDINSNLNHQASGTLNFTGSVGANIVTAQLVLSVVTASISTDQNNFSPAGWNDADPNKAVTLAVSAGFSSKITGLAGGTQGRMAILRNTSVDRLILIENNSLSSSAANLFAMRAPVFLMPSESFTVIYDSSISKWVPMAQAIKYNTFFDQYEEFTGAPAATTAQQTGTWAVAFSGTGATVAISTYLQNATERNLGIIQLTCGTTATGRSHVGLAQNNALFTARGQGLSLSRIAPQALSTAAQYYVAYSGWQNSVGAVSASNGVFWYYDISGSATWRGLAVSGNISSSLGITGPTVDINYIWLGIYVNATWTRAAFFTSNDSQNWVIAGEVSGSFPTSSAGASVGYGVGLNKFNGLTANLISVDTLAHRYDILRG